MPTTQGLISDALAAFLEGGNALIVATRDRALVTEGLRGCGLHIAADRTTATVFLPRQASGRVLANLESNGEIALAVVQPTTYRAYQLKGTFLAMRDLTADEQLLVQRHHDLFHQELAQIGMARSLIDQLNHPPCLAVDFAIRDLFHQTPGAEAGARL